MVHSGFKSHRRARRGVLLALMPALLLLFLALATFAVDFGRVQLAKAELQHAADAIARHTAGGLREASTDRRSLEAVADHLVLAQPLGPGDCTVQTGHYETDRRLFTVSTASPSAVRVTTHRRVGLAFGPLIGIPEVRLRATAVAVGWQELPHIIGLDGISLASGARIDSYDSSRPARDPANRSHHVVVGSNGDIAVKNNAVIDGAASIAHGGSAYGPITRGISTLEHPLSLPPNDARPWGPSKNNNNRIPTQFIQGQDLQVGTAQELRLPPGTYYFRDVEFRSNSHLQVLGPCVVYVTGRLSFAANSSTSMHPPKDLEFRVIGGGEVTFQNGVGADIFASVHAPHSDVRIDSNSHLYGRLEARTISLQSGGRIHADQALPRRTIGGVSLVE